MSAGVAQNIVNFALDIILVLGLHWGVTGAASAAATAFYVGAGVRTAYAVCAALQRQPASWQHELLWAISVAEPQVPPWQIAYASFT